jgi:hypothetical protein
MPLHGPEALGFDWGMRRYPQIDFQDISYYSAPKQKSEKVIPLTRLLCPLLSSSAFQPTAASSTCACCLTCMHAAVLFLW